MHMGAGKFEEIRAATESLSDKEKVILADILLANTGMNPDVDAYWRSELKERAARLKTSHLKTISLEEFERKHEAGPAFN